MGSLQDDLDRISALQGKSIPPGNVIAGDSRPWPVDAALPGDRTPQFDDPDDIDDFVRAKLAESPLIPKGAGAAPRPARPMAPEEVVHSSPASPAPDFLENFRAPDLSILGNDEAATVASYRGRQIELTPVEAAEVRMVVLQALKRENEALISETATLVPRRKRRRAGAGLKPRGQHGEGQPGIQTGFVESGVAGSPAPKKRGRPRKVAQ